MKYTKNKSLTQRTKPRKGTLGTAASYREAERQTGFHRDWIRRACDAGLARTPGGRISLDAACAWITDNREMLEATKDELSLKDQKLEQEIRRLRHANEKMEASLVSRAWLRERFERIGAEIAVLAEKSINEETPRLMAAGPDIASIRGEYKRVWDRISLGLQNCAEHLREE